MTDFRTEQLARKAAAKKRKRKGYFWVGLTGALTALLMGFLSLHFWWLVLLI